MALYFEKHARTGLKLPSIFPTFREEDKYSDS